MKVAIAGAGKVGRSIARELIANNHEVLLLDKNAAKAKQGAVSGAAVLVADACAVSTPRMLSALVEEAVTVGDLVRLMTFRQGDANLVELTLSPESRVVGNRVDTVVWPMDTALVAIVRGGRVITPTPDDTLEAGDELLFVSAEDQEEALENLLAD